ncbi:hypothetical protein GBAR_LOCUS13169 [Geodia barretti]|uniref:Uncharacterized protein n=1 Tax=Geodia barretti TaxID=519541 RepID=A0AA35WQC1_GEOBA|nr:hypothetical protein GBAR_LOCUS13169 [Geodia barretti]
MFLILSCARCVLGRRMTTATDPAPRIPGRPDVLHSLSILAAYQSQSEAKKRGVLGGHGLCIASPLKPSNSNATPSPASSDIIEVFTLEYRWLDEEWSGKTVSDPQWIDAVARSTCPTLWTNLDGCEVYCTPPGKKTLKLKKTNLAMKALGLSHSQLLWISTSLLQTLDM